MTAIEPAAFRLEPSAQDGTLAEGLRMAIADPAWMLARQRQFGELTAHDAGSPSAANLTWQSTPLTRYQPALPDGTAGQSSALDAIPLEAVVEHDRTVDAPDALLRGLAGLHFRRLLAPLGATDPAITSYLAELRAVFPLAVPDTEQPLLVMLSGAALDGAALYEALRSALAQDPPSLPADPPLPVASRPAAILAARSFTAYFEALTGTRRDSADAWVPARLEYQFGLGGRAPDGGEVTLAGDQYDSGQLDWYSVDASLEGVGADHDPVPLPEHDLTFLPAPVTFPGMPASRLWTIEDSTVNIDGLQAAPEDVAAMLVLEFALSYSDEFYLLPMPLPVGSLWAITGLTVTDTFAVTTSVPPADALSLFTLDQRRGSGHSPWSVLFPSVIDSRTSAATELVELRRDEVADLFWAVERRVTASDGTIVDRDAAVAASRAAQPTATGGRSYHLHTAVPSNWYPLMPSPGAPAGLSLSSVAGQLPPSGAVLAGVAVAPIAQEEVTRVGKKITRRWRYTRGADGSQQLWSGRRVEPAPPAASIRLRFDGACLKTTTNQLSGGSRTDPSP